MSDNEPKTFNENIKDASVALTGDYSVVENGSPLPVVLKYKFVAFAFLIFLLTNFINQYSKNGMWKQASFDIHYLAKYFVKLLFAFGFYLPIAYSVGRGNAPLATLKPVLYYHVVAIIAYKLLEPLQRCTIGAYNGSTADPSYCRDPDADQGRSGPLTKFTDMFIEPVLSIIESTTIVDLRTGGNVFRQVKDTNPLTLIKTLNKDEVKETRGVYTNILDSLIYYFQVTPIFLAIVLGIVFGLFHRAWTKMN